MSNACFLHCIFFLENTFVQLLDLFFINTSNTDHFLRKCLSLNNIVISWKVNTFKEKRKKLVYK